MAAGRETDDSAESGDAVPGHVIQKISAFEQQLVGINRSESGTALPQPVADNLKRKAKRLARSKYIGLVLGPLYGLFLYLYVAFVVLGSFAVISNREVVRLTSPSVFTENSSVVDDGGFDFRDLRQVFSTVGPSSDNDTTAGGSGGLADEEGEELSVRQKVMAQRHVIGASIGSSTGVGIIVSSYFYERARCTSMLMIPTLVVERGRSFMLNAVIGLMLGGPILTIEHNIAEISRCLTCLYQQTKSVADQYIEQGEKIFDSVSLMSANINELVTLYQSFLGDLTKDANRATRRKIENAGREVKEQAQEYEGKVKTLYGLLVKARDWCDTGKSIITLGFSRKCHTLYPSKPIGKRVMPSMPDIELDEFNNLLRTMTDAGERKLAEVQLGQAATKIQYNSIAEIKRRLQDLLGSFFHVVKYYSFYIQKLCYLYLLVVIYDATAYMRRFYMDDSFDNKHADRNLSRYSKIEGRPKVTPLRRWELRERYQYTKSFRLSGEELAYSGVHALLTVFALVVVSLFCGADYALSSLLLTFRENAIFGISYDGMEQGISLNSLIPGVVNGSSTVESLKLQAFDLSSEPCLPVPHITPTSTLAVIYGILAICLLSCIFDGYVSRVRARVCNMYYPRRCWERAQYLYARITTGRRSRRIQLNMIVARELDRRRRSKEMFSIMDWFSRWGCWRCRLGQHDKCPACLEVLDDSKPFSVARPLGKEESSICTDCFKDVK